MTVYIVLTTAGGDTGPFNLYSNVDGFISAFEVGVLKVDLEAGYNSYTAPDGTTVVRVMSDGICKNYIDIPITVGPIPTTTTSTTEPPIPPFPEECYCFNLTGIGEYLITWRDCSLTYYSFVGSNFNINICAKLGTIQTEGGDGSLIISNSGNLCFTEASCPTTSTTSSSTSTTTSSSSTTTTSSSSTTTTTSSSSTTTTSTTIGIPSYSFELLYDDISCSNACLGISTSTYYSADSVLGDFSLLYANPALTIPVIDGYYSNGSDCFTITDGIGTIDSTSSCSL